MSQPTKTALAVVAVIGLALAFWLVLLAPKREKADELGKQVSSLNAEIASERQRAEAGLAAKLAFPDDYQQLILLGKAVPAEAATPSLLVQLNGISAAANTGFNSIKLDDEGGEEGGEVATTETATEGAPVPAAAATEAAAALLPIGATVGPAGLPTLPYKMEFAGGYFDIADFFEGLDGLVRTRDGLVDANGRLVTIDSFVLVPKTQLKKKTILLGEFEVTTYSTPPGEGLTAGATEAGPVPTSAPDPSLP
jgi:Tfp pilus assembly protein PilO